MKHASMSWFLGTLLCMSSNITDAQPFGIGDQVQCGASFGKVLRTEPRPGWDEPFYIVEIDDAGSRYEARCSPQMLRAVAAAPDASDAPQRHGMSASSPAEPSIASTDSTSSTAPAAASGATDAALCLAGAKLEAQWGIQWYEVTVRGAPDASGACPVAFDGYGREWDTAIAADQLRARGGPGAITRAENAVADTGAASTPAEATAPDGSYRCHKISPGGELMDIGDLTIRGGEATLLGMPDGWTVRSVSSLGQNDQGQTLVAFDYLSASGFNDRLDCVQQ